ncbi:MAG: hypothetical protein QM765_00230 [Myxococcales bacterium]
MPRATLGCFSTWSVKALRSITSIVAGSSAMTLALRGWLSSRLISPKKSPGLKTERMTSRPLLP